MRTRTILVLATALLLPVAARADDEAPSAPQADAPASPPSVQPKLRLDVDKSKVDLRGHTLEVKASRELSKIAIKVSSESGAVLAQEEQSFSGRPAGTPLTVTWAPSSPETVARIELTAHDTAGFWVAVALIPWSVSIPHEDVRFKTGSAQIGDAEKAKLEASYGKLTEILSKAPELGPITLFIAGHTDTVGTSDDNLKLSRQRAQAISAWFRGRGLKLAIAFEGFGEYSLFVKTGDNVDEARNRRVDYILSLDEPVFKTTGNFRPSWKKL